jgi:sulfate permease, SulP family
VLIYLGLVLLAEWVYEAWLHSSRLDFLVIVTILAIIVTSGFLQGVVAGLILAVILFVVSYSRVSVIKFALSGREYRSRVTRGRHEQAVLEAHGDQLYVLKLEGFIFFGTANGLLSKLRAYRQNASTPLKYVVMDFSRVSGVDSTGMLSFARMLQWSIERGVELAFTGLSDALGPAFHRQRALNPEAMMQFFPDLDHGIEWCENELIAAYAPLQPRADNLIAALEEYMKLDTVRKLLPYLMRREFAPGEYLIKVGDAPDYLYFIESGQVTAQLEPAGGKPVRLETVQGGRTVGELGFYLGARRTASVVADQPSVVYALSAQDLRIMESSDVEAANILHRTILHLQNERVAHLTRSVGALERA